MYTDELIINRMPSEFTRQQLLKLVVVELGYSVSKAHQALEFALLTESIERTGRGKYRKVNSLEAEVRELHLIGRSYRQIADILSISKSQVGNILSKPSGQ